MFYKITFQFKTPIVFIERPLFDGILAFCYMRENYGEFDQKLNLTEEEIVDFFKVLPLGVVENEGIQYLSLIHI